MAPCAESPWSHWKLPRPCKEIFVCLYRGRRDALSGPTSRIIIHSRPTYVQLLHPRYMVGHSCAASYACWYHYLDARHLPTADSVRRCHTSVFFSSLRLHQLPDVVRGRVTSLSSIRHRLLDATYVHAINDAALQRRQRYDAVKVDRSITSHGQGAMRAARTVASVRGIIVGRKIRELG